MAPVNNRRAFTQVINKEDAATIRQRHEIKTDFSGIAESIPTQHETLEKFDVFDYELALSTYKANIASDPCPDLLVYPERDVVVLFPYIPYSSLPLFLLSSCFIFCLFIESFIFFLLI
jgi:hypothetical protein